LTRFSERRFREMDRDVRSAHAVEDEKTRENFGNDEAKCPTVVGGALAQTSRGFWRHVRDV